MKKNECGKREEAGTTGKTRRRALRWKKREGTVSAGSKKGIVLEERTKRKGKTPRGDGPAAGGKPGSSAKFQRRGKKRPLPAPGGERLGVDSGRKKTPRRGPTREKPPRKGLTKRQQEKKSAYEDAATLRG